MRFTIGLPTDHVGHAGEFVTGDAVMECAAAAEAAGFDACFVTDHPAPDSKWLAGGGHHALDPFVALSFAAAATTRLRVQTHILVLPYRNPLLTAKSVLSLDVLSGGRVILGVASGYLKPEFAALGVDFDERNELTDEAIDVMRRAWTEDEVVVEGRHFRTRWHVDAAASPATARPADLDRRQQHRRDPASRGTRAGMGPVPESRRAHLTRADPRAVEPRRAGPAHADPARSRRRDRAHRADRRVLLALRARRERDRRRAASARIARGHLGGAARARREARPAWIDGTRRVADEIIAAYRGSS